VTQPFGDSRAYPFAEVVETATSLPATDRLTLEVATRQAIASQVELLMHIINQPSTRKVLFDHPDFQTAVTAVILETPREVVHEYPDIELEKEYTTPARSSKIAILIGGLLGLICGIVMTISSPLVESGLHILVATTCGLLIGQLFEKSHTSTLADVIVVRKEASIPSTRAPRHTRTRD